MADDGPPPNDHVTTTPAADGAREWEKPWTISEMRQGANNWSLAGDSRLLLYLQDFSQKMISKVHEIEKEVDGLMHESKLTSVRMNNVFNDFIMLANTQFVENRVYDEDVNQDEAAKSGDQGEEKEKTREERESELIPRVKEALTLGIDVIDKAFEQLDSHVVDSDSEDDDIAYRVDPLLEAKDPYIARPLPLMIGTPKFMEDDTVGLREEESGGEETDVGSISESEDEEEVKKKPLSDSDESSDEYSDSDESETEKAPPKKDKKVIQSESDSDEGDLFGDTKKKGSESEEDSEEEEEDNDEEEEEEEEKPAPKPAGPGGFAAELAAKIGGSIPKPAAVSDAEDEEEEKPQKSKEKKKRKSKTSSSEKVKDTKGHTKKVDNDEPFPADDEDDSPFGNKGGLFSSKGGLFDDDDDDEGGLFDEVMGNKSKSSKKIEEDEEIKPVEDKQRKRSKSGKKVSMSEDDGLFTSSSKEVKKDKPKASSGGGGLFDDEDEEDDMFSSVSAAKSETKTAKEPSKTKPSADLFADEDDDEEDDLFSGQKTEEQKVIKEEPKADKNKKKLPPGAVSMFGGAPNPLAAAIKKRQPDSDKEDEGDWSEDEKPRASSVKSNQSTTSVNSLPKAVKTSNKPSPSPSSNSLFDDDADDPLFSAAPKPRADSKSKAKPTKSLFDDNEDALFGGTKAAAKTPAKQKEEKPRSGSLFDEEEDGDDLFGVPAKPKEVVKKKPAGGVSLFGGTDVLGVGSKDKTPEKKSEPAKPKAVVSNKLSLFDDEDEEEDLFGGGASAVKTEKVTPQKQSKAPGLSKSLFSEEDDDDLFGEQTGESPGVDIFSSSKPKNAGKESGPLDIGGATTSESTDSPDQKAVKEPASKKPVGGVSMFGGMDPFSAIKKKKAADEENTAPETVTSKPTKVEQAKPTKTADPLFGEEEEEEDDLFGGNSSKPPSKSVPQGDDLFGSPKSEDDLFNSSPPKPPVTQVSEDKPKKPAGAVSMFGGVDPFSAMKKKSPSSEEQTGSGKTEEEKPAVSSPPQDDLFGSPKSDDDLFGSVPKSPDIQESSKEIKPKKPPGAVSMFGGMDPFAARKTKTSTSSEDKDDSTVASPVNESSEPVKPASKVGRLKMNIGINPAALLPGAAPPVKEPENVVVGFDVPAEAKTLHSANKDRAKIQTKRRPPSRRGRQSAGDTVQSIPNGLPEVHHDPPSETSGLPDLPPIDNVRVSPPSDLFGNDDLLGESSGQTKLPEPKISENQSNDLFSSDQDDLFSPKKEKKKSPLNDDLFSPAKKDSQSIKTADDDGDDDIFGTSSVKVRPSNKSKSAISNGETTKTKDDTKSEKKTAIDDDDEDIFATKPKSKKATDYEKLFDKDPVGKQGADNSNVSKESKTVEDDDDIFGNSSLGKSKAKDQEGKSEKKEEKNNKQEEEDDIFATTEKTTKKVRNRPKTKDEDLFKDDTDIFADVPASKPKEKKKKKVGEKKPGIFKDDVDDIFADVAAPKVKKEKKKVDTAKTKTKSVDVSDIFDDPLK